MTNCTSTWNAHCGGNYFLDVFLIKGANDYFTFWCYWFHQGRDVFSAICLFVCRITEKHDFHENLVEGWAKEEPVWFWSQSELKSGYTNSFSLLLNLQYMHMALTLEVTCEHGGGLAVNSVLLQSISVHTRTQKRLQTLISTSCLPHSR